MNANDGRTGDPSAAEFAWIRIGLSAPPWWLRWKLGWIIGDIDDIERRLSDEFGLIETAPLNAEHVALINERDALMRRLADPAGRSMGA